MTEKAILVTRAQGDEAELTEALHALDLRVIHEPLTQVFLLHTAAGALAQALTRDPDAIIATSRHGAAALAALTELRDMAIIAVGEATAETAESCGFTRVFSAGGDVEKLFDYLAAAYDAGAKFLYVSAMQVRADLPAKLHSIGMEAERIAVYEAIASEQLSDTLIEQLKRRQLHGVTFFSQRTAQIFLKLLESASLEEATADLHAFALSDAVAEPLMACKWQAIHVARQPTLASLVAEVDNVFHDRRT